MNEKKTGWIPITEALPALHYEEDGCGGWRESERCLVYGRKKTGAAGIRIATYTMDEAFEGWITPDGTVLKNVTHWMPLPSAPEEKQK